MHVENDHHADRSEGSSQSAGGGSDQSVRILVNRRVVELETKETNHAHIVALAHPGVSTSATRSFTIAFSRGGHVRPEGFVAPGERIDVVVGQEFYVAIADQS